MATLQLQHLSKAIAMMRSRLLYGLDQTPDDRLDWRPGEGALTPLQLAGKTAGIAHFLAHLVQNRTMPERPASPPPPPRSREEAKAALEAAFARLQSAVRELGETDLAQTAATPWGREITVAEMLWWIPGALGYQQGQLNYVQTAYGDQEPNIPPNWGQDEG